MPVPDQRDPAVTSSRLTTWLRGRLPDAGDLSVTSLRTPAASGFSSETLLFDAEWTEAGRRRREPLAVRVGPTGYRLFPEPRFDDLCRVMQILDRETDVPMPPIRWHEPAPDLLGAPFLVMDRVEGLVPGDHPTYHQEGWVVEAAPADRARMWWGALEILARIHRLDVEALGLGFVDRPEHGPTGLDQQLGYYERFLSWAGSCEVPVATAALAWLRRWRPPERGPRSLLWGDARIGNVIFEDYVPRAVLDWEMVTLGPAEVDLAWFLYLDRHHSEGVGAPRLAGFPGQEETVERYQELVGRPVGDLAYYEVFAAFRFTVIMARIGQVFMDLGLLPPDSDFPTANTGARLLGRILEERC